MADVRVTECRPSLQVAWYVAAVSLCLSVWSGLVFTVVTIIVFGYTAAFGRRDELLWNSFHTQWPIWLASVAQLVAIVTLTRRRRGLAASAFATIVVAAVLGLVANLRHDTGQVSDPAWAYVLGQLTGLVPLSVAFGLLVADRRHWDMSEPVGTWTQWLLDVGLPTAAAQFVATLGGSLLAAAVGLEPYGSLFQLAGILVAAWLCRRRLGLGRSPRVRMIGLTLLLLSSVPSLVHTTYLDTASRSAAHETTLDPTTVAISVFVAILIVIACVQVLGVRARRTFAEHEGDRS